MTERPRERRHETDGSMKLAGDPNNPVRIRDDATLEELRAEKMKHLGILIEGGLSISFAGDETTHQDGQSECESEHSRRLNQSVMSGGLISTSI